MTRPTQIIALALALALLTAGPRAEACWHADQHREFVIATSKDASRYATAKVILHRDEQYGATAGASFYCVYRTLDGRQQGPCRLVRRYDYPRDLGATIVFANAFFTDKVHDTRTRFLAGPGRAFSPAYGGLRDSMYPLTVASWNPMAWRVMLCAVKPGGAQQRFVCGQTPAPCDGKGAACFSHLERAKMLERPALLGQVRKQAYVCHAVKDTPKARRARVPTFGALKDVTWIPGGLNFLARFSRRFGSGNHLNHSDVIVYLDLKRMTPLQVRVLGKGAVVAPLIKVLNSHFVARKLKAALPPARGRIRVRPEYWPLADWLVQQLGQSPDRWEIKVEDALDVGLEIAPPAPPPRGHEWWGR